MKSRLLMTNRTLGRRVINRMKPCSERVLSSLKVSDPPKPVSFHKRPLPVNLVALSSQLGKLYFRRALDEGYMEAYFPLSEQFITQSEPSYCSLSSLAMVLNALNHDPKKVWKGAWRWVSEETLQCESAQICGHTLERVRSGGLSFTEFESLARCHGVRISSNVVHPKPAPTEQTSNSASCKVVRSERCDELIAQHRQHMLGFADFKRLVESSCQDPSARRFLVVNFARSVLGQTGSGHFSPIGGIYRDRDESSSSSSSKVWVLIMDVARFKYPPYWVDIRVLWEAMGTIDKDTQQPRGYFTISAWEEEHKQEQQYNTVAVVDRQSQYLYHDQPSSINANSNVMMHSANGIPKSSSSSSESKEQQQQQGVMACASKVNNLGPAHDNRISVSTTSGTGYPSSSSSSITTRGAAVNAPRRQCPPRIRTWQEL